MLFIDIVNDTITARFNTGQTDQVKRWINMREAQIWATAEWPWKTWTIDLTVTANDATTTIADGAVAPLAIYTPDGDKLTPMTEADFDDVFIPRAASGVTGTPTHFKWNNQVITLGDVPSATSTEWKCRYLANLYHFDNTDAEVAGPMVEDDDYPVFDAQWHQILVMGALSTGLKIENDPTWEALEQEFMFMLDQMREHYLPSIAVAGNMQYGANDY